MDGLWRSRGWRGDLASSMLPGPTIANPSPVVPLPVGRLASGDGGRPVDASVNRLGVRPCPDGRARAPGSAASALGLPSVDPCGRGVDSLWMECGQPGPAWGRGAQQGVDALWTACGQLSFETEVSAGSSALRRRVSAEHRSEGRWCLSFGLWCSPLSPTLPHKGGECADWFQPEPQSEARSGECIITGKIVPSEASGPGQLGWSASLGGLLRSPQRALSPLVGESWREGSRPKAFTCPADEPHSSPCPSAISASPVSARIPRLASDGRGGKDKADNRRHAAGPGTLQRWKSWGKPGDRQWTGCGQVRRCRPLCLPRSARNGNARAPHRLRRSAFRKGRRPLAPSRETVDAKHPDEGCKLLVQRVFSDTSCRMRGADTPHPSLTRHLLPQGEKVIASPGRSSHAPPADP